MLIDCDDPDPQAVAALAAAESTRSLVVAGRVVRTELRAALDQYDCLELGAGDLGLSVDETAAAFRTAVTVDPGLAELIHAQSGGWPAVIVALARSATAGSLQEGVAGGIVHHPAVNQFLRATIDTWPDEIRDAIGRFATLERVTVAALDDMSRRHLARDAVRAGVPLVVRDDGWIELPAVVREHLGPPSVADCSAIAPHLARSGGLVPAVRALVGSGGYVAAGELLADVRPEALDGADELEVLGLLDVVERHVDSPRLGMLRVRALEHLGDPVAAAAAAEEVVRSSSPDTVEHVDARLELAWVAAMRGQPADTEGWSDRATDPRTAGPARRDRGDPALAAVEPRRRPRRGKGTRPRRGPLGGPRLQRPSVERPAGDGRGPAHPPGRVRPGDRCRPTRQAVVVAPLVRPRRVHGVPRPNRRARREARRPRPGGRGGHAARRLGLRAVVASLCELGARAPGRARRRRRGRRRGGDRHRTGPRRARGSLHRHRAVRRTRSGAGDGRAARSSRPSTSSERSPGATTIRSRSILRRRSSPLAPAGSTKRHGAPTRCEPTPPCLRRGCGGIDLESALAIGDDAAVEQALSAASAIGSEDAARLIVDAVASTDANHPRLRVSVMGELSVAVAGELVATPSGKPGELLKLLATQPGPVSTGSLIDVMWPDADEETGLRRLKNPVNRLRGALGTANVIRRNGQVALAPAVTVDLREFETLSITAHARHDDETGVQAAISALNLYAPVLPGDELEAVATAALAAQNRAAGLVDLVMAAPLADRPGSAWLLATALRVDPYDDDRLIAIAEVALVEDNVVCARRCLAEVRRIAARARRAAGRSGPPDRGGACAARRRCGDQRIDHVIQVPLSTSVVRSVVTARGEAIAKAAT